MHNSKPKAAEAMPVVSEEADDAKRYRGAALQHNLWIDVVGHSTMQYTIGKAMRAVGFSEADSKDPTKQMRVRRLKNSSPMSAATTPSAIVAAAVVTPVSEVIKPIAASSTALSARNDLLEGCRRTQQQMHSANRVHSKLGRPIERISRTAPAGLHRNKIYTQASGRRKE